LDNAYINYTNEITTLEENKRILTNLIKAYENSISSKKANKKLINSTFEKKYAPFIKEGTWKDD
jgi:hypothetical protein